MTISETIRIYIEKNVLQENLEGIYIHGNEIKKLKEKDNPLEYDLLRKFLNSHDGFNHEDLPHCLILYCFMQNPPGSKLEKIDKFVNCAVHLSKTLK